MLTELRFIEPEVPGAVCVVLPAVTNQGPHFDPEDDSMRLVVTGADGALTSSTFAIGRAGLNALYVEWVGHSPDADNGAPIPICDLLDLVAGALLFNSRQGREK